MTSEEMKNMVEGVKHNDADATLLLCNYFEPLVNATACRYKNVTTPVEDAISLSWIILLEFIKSYDSDDYEVLPGLLREVLKTRLLNAVTNKSNYDDRVTYVADLGLCRLYGLEAEEQIANLDLQAALRRLNKRELDFIYLRYYRDLSYKKIAQLTGKSRTALFKKNARILRKLSKLMDK